MNKRDLAAHLGISVRGVEGLMHARKIPFFTFGHRTVRFDLQRVLAALADYEVKAS